MIDVCDVCNEQSSNCRKDGTMIICDSCEEEFDGCAAANDWHGEAQEQSHDSQNP